MVLTTKDINVDVEVKEECLSVYEDSGADSEPGNGINEDLYLLVVTNEVDAPDASTKWKCNVCKKQFKRRHNLIHHLKMHIVRKPKTAGMIRCVHCPAEFKPSDLRDHLKVTHRQYTCTCGKGYANLSSLQRHVRMDHLNMPTFDCQICFKVYKTSQGLKIHTTNKHLPKTRDYTCEHCKNTYESAHYLKKHQIKVHITKLVQCDYCKKEFRTRYKLMRHIKRHNSGMVEGRNRHGTAADFVVPCDECTQKFRTQYVLQMHKKKVHIGGKRCRRCKKRFKTLYHLHKHMSRKHGISFFVCDVCGKKLTKKDSIKKHLTVYHGIKLGKEKRNKKSALQ